MTQDAQSGANQDLEEQIRKELCNKILDQLKNAQDADDIVRSVRPLVELYETMFGKYSVK